eukprot:TRINITY_DN1801_c1_g1_i4.p2 TRINITY_DN1801_c1_g1~~TRINITY_DN1801_c1_g1_i4.p2  ORF type:complete len:255 (-),score=37.52 TRINITY_DN1801_c1_g1_i4:1004-1768(-)
MRWPQPPGGCSPPHPPPPHVGGGLCHLPPRAVVISCADAAPVADAVFGSPPGELVDVRALGPHVEAAGGGAAAVAAATAAGARLVVVLGHTGCGVAAATVAAAAAEPGADADEPAAWAAMLRHVLLPHVAAVGGGGAPLAAGLPAWPRPRAARSPTRSPPRRYNRRWGDCGGGACVGTWPLSVPCTMRQRGWSGRWHRRGGAARRRASPQMHFMGGRCGARRVDTPSAINRHGASAARPHSTENAGRPAEAASV